jgi:hypothetical protein
MIEKKHWAQWNRVWTSYTTPFTYDGLDRSVTLTYPPMRW